MSRATDDLLDTLHGITAAELIKIIQNGVEILDKNGEITTVPAPAAYIATAIKFLKDNGITSEPSSKRLTDVSNAVSNLPAFDEDEYHYPN